MCVNGSAFFCWFKSLGNLAQHRKKTQQNIKAALILEAARNNTQYFFFPTSMGVFQVGFSRDTALVCSLVLMQP